jgi:serine/threonine protein kinase
MLSGLRSRLLLSATFALRGVAMTEESLFHLALEKPAAARAVFLAQACGDDAALCRRVEQLLHSHEHTCGFMAQPFTWATRGAEVPGTQIGPYRLREPIGEGGMGVVFLAEQQEPVQRQVALKLIKPGMDSRHIIARFEAERQALALMDHPNIAHVLDAGTTDAGRPYFVMQLCRGVPITEYCDRQGLALRERLALFVTVCQAMQHAHQKGIIHRDLKPSNVLVVTGNGEGGNVEGGNAASGAVAVKVIDFGIAKALEQKLEDHTVLTGAAQMLGTPMYMSPEQAAMSGDIDTRSDIYSLGVLLYEMLTGTTPFDRGRLRAASFDEVRQIIRQEEPPRPSTRLSAGGAATTASAQRHSDPRRLSRRLRGELDWIVMKTLEKERGRRYESASALAADIERYLHDEPVAACPPSAWYRAGKVARRHRGKLVVAGLGLAALLVGVAAVAGSISWAVSDRRTRDAALDRQVDLALDEAVSLLETGKWPEALDSLERIEKLLDAAGRGERPSRFGALKRQAAMARRLEDLYAQAASELPSITGARYAKVDDRAYAEVFTAYGIDLAATPAAEAAERLRASSIRLDLARALDIWSSLRRRAASNQQPDWQQLLEFAKLADADDARNRLRTALQNDDRQVFLALAGSVDVRDLPPSTLALLAFALAERLDAPDKAVTVLPSVNTPGTCGSTAPWAGIATPGCTPVSTTMRPASFQSPSRSARRAFSCATVWAERSWKNPLTPKPLPNSPGPSSYARITRRPGSTGAWPRHG